MVITVKLIYDNQKANVYILIASSSIWLMLHLFSKRNKTNFGCVTLLYVHVVQVRVSGPIKSATVQYTVPTVPTAVS